MNNDGADHSPGTGLIGGKLIHFEPIGLIRTPYVDCAPHQPVEDDPGEFRIIIDRRYQKGLDQLATFHYLYVLFYFHRLDREIKLTVSPPQAKGRRVGLFASRSPARPNRIGLSIVKLLNIEESIIYISGIDALDKTPLLDLKPYVKDLDLKSDANRGWLDDVVDPVASARQFE